MSRRNHIKEALSAAGDRLREPFAGLSEERRIAIAGACYAFAEVTPEIVPADEEDEAARDMTLTMQMAGRQILGALYCALLTGCAEEEAEALGAFIADVAAIGIEDIARRWAERDPSDRAEIERTQRECDLASAALERAQKANHAARMRFADASAPPKESE